MPFNWCFTIYNVSFNGCCHWCVTTASVAPAAYKAEAVSLQDFNSRIRFLSVRLVFLSTRFVEQRQLESQQKVWRVKVNLQHFCRVSCKHACGFVVIFQRVTSWSSRRRQTTAGSRWCAAWTTRDASPSGCLRRSDCSRGGSSPAASSVFLSWLPVLCVFTFIVYCKHLQVALNVQFRFNGESLHSASLFLCALLIISSVCLCFQRDAARSRDEEQADLQPHQLQPRGPHGTRRRHPDP